MKEVSKIDLGNIKSIDPTDHIAMRQWLKDEYMPLQKAPRIKRSRTPVSIDIKNVPIIYGEDNHFSIRVYDPVNKESPSDRLRPALIMLHGGGWVHGYPEVDEGIYSPADPYHEEYSLICAKIYHSSLHPSCER